MALNAKQELFVLSYAKTGDTIEAYKEAGYKVKSNNVASRAARRLLERPEIQERLQELHEEIRSSRICEAIEIQEILSSIARGEMQEEVLVIEGCGSGVTECKSKWKSPTNTDRIKAATTLAKMQGVLEQPVNVSVTVPVFGGEQMLES